MTREQLEAVRDELERLAQHIWEYVGLEDARDDIRRICRNRVVSISAQLAAMPDDNGWFDIAGAPKDGTPVLIYKQTGVWRVVGIGTWRSLVIDGIEQGGWIATPIYDVPGVLGLGNPTHYRPIPAGPGQVARAEEKAR
jgi:hypothetical protein